jgi:hypothetical protein
MELPAGDYQIISIYLEDSAENIIYATPNTGSLLAGKTMTPLPFSFTVAANSNRDITMEAISTRSFSSEDFGFDPSITNFKEECDGGTYQGNVLLQSQTDVDEFGTNCYTAIKGNLRIEENQTEDP